MIKYLICPGEITSKNDGDTHYISARQLIDLYKVDPMECKIINSPESAYGVDWAKYIVLRPRYEGNYQLTHHYETKNI